MLSQLDSPLRVLKMLWLLHHPRGGKAGVKKDRLGLNCRDCETVTSYQASQSLGRKGLRPVVNLELATPQIRISEDKKSELPKLILDMSSAKPNHEASPEQVCCPPSSPA